MMLSHGHWDHAGAMLQALDLMQLANGGRAVPTYMHPDMYAQRAMRAPDGSMRPFDDIPSPQALARHGAHVVHSRQPQTVLDDCFYISGEIPRVSGFEIGLPGQHRRIDDSSDWEPDPLLRDERFLAVRIRDKGLFVFSACSHAGIVNVLTHARDRFPGVPLHGVMGGFHLAGVHEKIIPQTVDAMRAFDLSVIAAAHCTGWRALSALSAAFGPAVVPCSVGKTFTLQAAVVQT